MKGKITDCNQFISYPYLLIWDVCDHLTFDEKSEDWILDLITAERLLCGFLFAGGAE